MRCSRSLCGSHVWKGDGRDCCEHYYCPAGNCESGRDPREKSRSSFKEKILEPHRTGEPEYKFDASDARAFGLTCLSNPRENRRDLDFGCRNRRAVCFGGCGSIAITTVAQVARPKTWRYLEGLNSYLSSLDCLPRTASSLRFRRDRRMGD